MTAVALPSWRPFESLARLGLGALLAALGWVANDALGTTPGLATLRYEAVAGFVAGMFFGWAGPLGAGLATLARGWPEPGPFGAVTLALAPVALGWTAFAAFRLTGGGRGLTGVRACVTLLAAATVGAGLTALLVVPVRFPSAGRDGIQLWWTAGLTSIALAVPPLAVALRRVRVRWTAPLGPRGDAAAPAVRRRPAGSGRRPASRFDWIGPLALIVAIGLALRWFGSQPAGVISWLVVLYIVPLIWAAHRRGLVGGILMGSAVGICYLVARSVSFDSPEGWETWHRLTMSQHAAAIGFAVVGALLGSNRDQELALRRELGAVNRRLRDELASVVQALRSALGAKDAYTEGHVGRVASYAVATGRRLGMDRRDLEMLEVAALLHDVGKIGIPEAILHKAGPLEAEEREIMQRHPQIGAGILEDLEGLRDAAPLVLHHQERFDGRRDGDWAGYPDGLQGDEIPLGARIIAVVDAFDAMTSNRAYRSALGIERAVEVLEEERGRQFDPRVVDAFLETVAQRPWTA
jgi:hypothetical protein